MEKSKQGIVDRFEELGQLLMDPRVMGDTEQYTRVVKEHAELEKLVSALREETRLERELEQAKELLDEAEEAALRELAREELRLLQAAREENAALVRRLMAPKDPRDSRGLLLEIRSGAGGEEAALFAATLYKMYSAFAQSHQIAVELVEVNETELGGVRELVCELQGEGAFSLFKYESGVHRVQRVPVTESGGRIHTSTCTVAVMPEVDEVELAISPSDLQIDTYRASGAGGQHVNKTSSAIRITHLPTGLVVTCQDERSQHKNKDKAMRVLRARLLASAKEEAKSAEDALRKNQVGSGERSERIRTYNFPQGRVSDHRIGLTLYRLEAVLAGDMQELVEKLRAAERSADLSRGEVDS